MHQRRIVMVLAAGMILAWHGPVTAAEGTAGNHVVVEKIDHVMVCVTDLKRATAAYSDLFGNGFHAIDPLALDGWGVKRAAINAIGIELIEAAPAGPAAEFIQAVGETLTGIAFKVPDLEQGVAAMQARQIRLISRGANSVRKVAVFQPEDAHGVMIKLVEYVPAYTVGELDLVEAWRQAQGRPATAAPASGKPQILAEKIDHVLIRVGDINHARAFFGELFGTVFPEPHAMAGSRSEMCVDGLGLELLSALRTGAGSQDGVGAVSFKVPNYEQAAAAMESRGLKPGMTRSLPTRKVALYAGGGGIGMGIELIEYRPLAHPIASLEMRGKLFEGDSGVTSVASGMSMASMAAGPSSGHVAATPSSADSAKPGQVQAAGVAQYFDKLDANLDGQLTKDEFRPLAQASPRLKGHPEQADGLFGQLDANRDGFLSREEFAALDNMRPAAASRTSASAAATAKSKSITLRLEPVAGSGVSGEVTLTPHQGQWSKGMDVSATVQSEKDIRTFRDRHLIVNMFSEPNCRFEDSLANFYDPTDPKVDHSVVFEEGFWSRTGTWAYHIHPSKLYQLDASSGVRNMGVWRGREDIPIQEQVKSIGILSYSRSVPEYIASVLAGANLSGEPLKVAKVQTDEFEPKEPPEDATPVTVEISPVGNSGVHGQIDLRPYEYQRVGQDNWYRCYGFLTVHGIAGLDESVIAYVCSAPNGRWESREALFYDQWHNKSFLRDGAGMMVNGWATPLFDVPPGFQGHGGGWHAVRDKMQSVAIYNTKTQTLLAVGKIPPQRR